MDRLLNPPCPHCDGDGGWTEVVSYELGGPHYDCEYCDATGRVYWQRWLSYRWNVYFSNTKLGQWYYYQYIEFFDGPYHRFWHTLTDMASPEVIYPHYNDSE